jgi:hypothetical protein
VNNQTLNIQITEWWFVALVALTLAYFTARRTLTVGLYMLVSGLFGMLMADRLANFLEPWINFTYKCILAIMRERAFSPEALFKAALKQPPIITTPEQRLVLGSGVFLAVMLIGYLIGKQQARKARPMRRTTRVLAALVGAVNGYLLAFYIFPRHFTAQKTIVTVPNVNVRNLLQVQLNLPIIAMIVVIITMAVLEARAGRSK